MNKTKNPDRLKYWDIAKGITILLVVLGHAENVNPFIRVAIFSYHMPFFVYCLPTPPPVPPYG